MQIIYTSKDGYTGVLYGERSLVIYNPDGTESLHTGRRNINTYEELKKMVDDYPKLLKIFAEAARNVKGPGSEQFTK